MKQNKNADFNSVMIFIKKIWSKKEIKNFLNQYAIGYQLRVGWKYFLAVCDCQVNINAILSKKWILCVNVTEDNAMIKKEAFIFKNNKYKIINAKNLIERKNDIIIHLTHFGYYPKGGEKIEDIYAQLVEWAEERNIRDSYSTKFDRIISNNTISDEIKKYLLDILGLRIAIFAGMGKKQDNIPTQYSTLLLVTFAIRAQADKMMFLLAKIDESLDFTKLRNASGRIKRKFLKEAKESTLHVTQDFVNFLDALQILDDKYRTPEAHKMGRLLGLVSKHFGTLINEVLSFEFDLYKHLADICDYISSKHR